MKSLPFFFDYYHSVMAGNVPVWPNGKTRLYQVVKLQKIFDLLFFAKAKISGSGSPDSGSNSNMSMPSNYMGNRVNG